MKLKRYFALALIALAIIQAASTAPGSGLVPEPARPADSLVDSIGVCTHWGYSNSVYGKSWDKMQELFGALGVRTIRDGLGPRLETLWNDYGAKAILVTSPVAPWDKYVQDWKANKHLIAAIEGPNEVNCAWGYAKFGYEGEWWDGAHRFQQDLYKTVKGDPDLHGIPVIALSTAYKGGGSGLAPLQGSLDYANAHSYAGGGIPSKSIDLRDSYLLLGPGAVLPPMVATECGYHTCFGATNVKAGSQAGVSHGVHKKYIPRQAAEYFNAGYQWACIYEFGAGRAKPELADPEAAFGLVTPDATPKPAYFALKDLIADVSESKWDAAAHQWKKPAPFPVRALSFALQGAPSTLHHTVLQRSDGSFQLLLWNEIPSIDLGAKRDIVNPDVPVHLTLGQPAAITVLHLGPDAPAPQQFPSAAEIDVKVPDEVIVLNIKPAEPLHPAPINPPAKIDAKTTPTSIDLSWPFAPGVDAYWITVNNRNMGMAQRGADGKAHFSATRLIPATTYPFEIVATSLDGGVSSPAKAPTATVDAFPDLVVKSFKVVPESPKSGEKVGFVAVVENIGKAPTEEGAPIGFRIYVDGKTVTRNDWVTGLAPGQQAEVKPAGAGAGMTWVVTPGNHNITASVDDYNRLIESNENNNKLTIPLAAK